MGQRKYTYHPSCAAVNEKTGKNWWNITKYRKMRIGKIGYGKNGKREK